MRVDEEFKTYLQVLWRHKWMVAAAAAIALVVALGVSLLLTPIYTATTTVRVASAFTGATDYVSLTSITRLSNTLVDIANSDTSLWEVAKQLGMEKKPDVEIEVVPETELIDIKASSPIPAQARNIANTIAAMMVEQSIRFYAGSGPTAREILDGQLTWARADLDAAVAAYDAALQGAAVAASPVAGATPMPNAEVEKLARIMSVRQQMYGEILVRYEDARINEQLRAKTVSVVEPATLPLRPSSPQIPLNAALGLLAGLVVGVILSFLFEGADDTVRDVEDVQSVSALPIIGQVPHSPQRLAGIFRLSAAQPGSLLDERAFEQLGAQLLLSRATQRFASYLITSPEPGAGKSTIAANLAMSLAKGGRRVVLVDMDFRRPRLHTVLQTGAGPGLSDYLSGKVPLAAALRNGAYANLRVATAGTRVLNVSTLFAPARIQELLATLSKDAECVIVDAPALLAVADAAVLACEVDAVLVVVAQRSTERKALRLTLQQLAQLNAHVAGIIVNKVPGSRPYGYYSDIQQMEVARPGGSRKPAVIASGKKPVDTS